MASGDGLAKLIAGAKRLKWKFRPSIAFNSLVWILSIGFVAGSSSELRFEHMDLESISSLDLCSSHSLRMSPVDGELNELSLANNRIKEIHSNAFSCLGETLKILNLRDNQIEFIHAKAFKLLARVQVMQLDSNQLHEIPSIESLEPLVSLRHLNLANNKIEVLPSGAFGPSSGQLISLNLRANPLRQVASNSLVALTKLKTLTMTSASLSGQLEPLLGLTDLRFYHLDRQTSGLASVSENLCSSSRQLATLILESNRMDRVPRLTHCQSLLLMDLTYNNISGTLASQTFQMHPNLIDLYLGYNQIEALDEFAFVGLSKLQVLALNNNRLKWIHSNSFRPLRFTLQDLNLAHNSRLGQLSADGLDGIVSVKVYGNPQLRHLPHFSSARVLALTYAYHCCDYLESQRSNHKPAVSSNDTGNWWPFTRLSDFFTQSLTTQNEPQVGHSNGATNSLASDELSELILWTNSSHLLIRTEEANGTEISSRPRQSSRLRRSNGKTEPYEYYSSMIDELVGQIILARVRRSEEQVRVSHLRPRRMVSPSEAFNGTSTSLSSSDSWFTVMRLATETLALDANREFASNGRPKRESNLQVTGATIKTRERQPLVCLPEPSAFFPCRDLFDTWWLRLGIWAVFLLALTGNLMVVLVLSSVSSSSSTSALTSIMWLAHSKRHIDVPRFLVINLAIADLLMAAYLGILASVDLSTLGEFKSHAIKWQYSSGCKLAGFLGVLSSELSVFILAIITLERNYAITNAVHLNRRLSLQKATIIMIFGYLFALTMALLPLNGVSDYRKFSVCLPLDYHSNLSSKVYIITLIGINSFSFLLLISCYLRMYCAIRGSQAWNTNDLRIAKRMSILVITDFLCWSPIIVAGICSLFGYYLVTSEGMKILTIFILPLNSVANPFLYAITTKKFKKDLNTLMRRVSASLDLLTCKSTESKFNEHNNLKSGFNNYQANMSRKNLSRKITNGNNLSFRVHVVTTNERRRYASRREHQAMQTANQVTMNKTTCSCQQQVINLPICEYTIEAAVPLVSIQPKIVLDSAESAPEIPVKPIKESRSLESVELSSVKCEKHQVVTSIGKSSFLLVDCQAASGANKSLLSRDLTSTANNNNDDQSHQSPRSHTLRPRSADEEAEGHNKSPKSISSNKSCQAMLSVDGSTPASCKVCPEVNLNASIHLNGNSMNEQNSNDCQDYRCASACGPRDLKNSAQKPNVRRDRQCEHLSCTNVKRSSRSNEKLSRSISRLLFSPIAKAWSSIQISLSPSNGANNLVNHESTSTQVLDEDTNNCCDCCPQEFRDKQQHLGHQDSNIPRIDDILQLGSPARRLLHASGRRMSRSCDVISGSQDQANDNFDFTLQSPSSSANENSQFDHQDDGRILLATINSLASGGHNQILMHRKFMKERQSRGRCTRCRSWSPALLSKLEDCIHQIRNKIPGLTLNRNGHPTQMLDLEDDLVNFERELDSQKEAQVESPQCSDCQSDSDLEDAYSDDQFDAESALPGWSRMRNSNQLRSSRKRLGHQSSLNSDTLSTRTGRTIMTMMSVSFDSNSNIPSLSDAKQQQVHTCLDLRAVKTLESERSENEANN